MATKWWTDALILHFVQDDTIKTLPLARTSTFVTSVDDKDELL